MKHDYTVVAVPLAIGQNMVKNHHYSKGGSNTCVYMHGMIRKNDGLCVAIAWWLPPTRVAAESVTLHGPREQHERSASEDWKHVLSLTRLVCLPGEAPRNACSFLLARSRKLIENDSRFNALITYADEAQGHMGAIYRADNWWYAGRTGPYPRWISSGGKQVAPKSTVNRTKSEMLALGHLLVGRFHKHKFVKRWKQNAPPTRKEAP